MNAAAAPLSPLTMPAHFVDNGDGTITDTRTGLMWSKATINPSGIMHKKALAACAKLDLAGHTDWRLPSVEELFLIADRTRKAPAIDTDVFPDTKNDWYWTSTASAWSSDCAWVVSFSGGAANDSRGSGGFVRAVRSVPAGQ